MIYILINWFIEMPFIAGKQYFICKTNGNGTPYEAHPTPGLKSSGGTYFRIIQKMCVRRIFISAWGLIKPFFGRGLTRGNFHGFVCEQNIAKTTYPHH